MWKLIKWGGFLYFLYLISIGSDYSSSVNYDEVSDNVRKNSKPIKYDLSMSPILCERFSWYGDYLTARKNNDNRAFEYQMKKTQCLHLDVNNPIFKRDLKVSVIDDGTYKNYYYCKLRVYIKNITAEGYVISNGNCLSEWNEFK